MHLKHVNIVDNLRIRNRYRCRLNVTLVSGAVAFAPLLRREPLLGRQRSIADEEIIV